MSRYTMCPVCGHRMTKIDDETYYCKYCGGEDEEDIPYGCRACGGPYPDCTTSCSMFDD